jgi:LysR family glycine cleavage system transcriptional activator
MDWSALPPLSTLRAFEAAARLGGFSAAARELNVTQAAVGQQVRGLEARLGVALMRREGRGLVLTPEGRRLAEGLTAGLETIRGALAAFIAGAAEGPVRVTLTPSFAAAWLTPRLGAFRQAHPGVELMLNPTTEVVDLVRSDYDLAIRYGAGSWPGVDAEPLLASPLVVAATPALLAGRRIERPADLLALPWVQEPDDDEWSVWLARHGVDARGKRDILHLPAPFAIQAIRDGQGAGMATRVYVGEDLKAGRLVALFDPGDAAAPAAYHLVRRRGALRPGADAFSRWLRRAARETGG